MESDAKLVITFDNKAPVELKDLARSFNAIAEQYARFVARTTDPSPNREARLCVKEIKAGSIIAELFDFAAQTAIPLMSDGVTVVGFAEYFQRGVNYLLGKTTKEEAPEMSSVDLKDFAQIVKPVAKDAASQMNVSSVVNGTVNLTVNINYPEANAIQNVAKVKRRELLAPEEDDDIKTEVLFYWVQARDDGKLDGNKAVIEDISDTPLNVTWASEELKDQMLRSSHPFNTVFVLDVQVQTVQGNPAAYKVLRLNSTFPKES
jgi:hypothetical protein